MTDELIRQRLLGSTLRHLEEASENIRALTQPETPAQDAHTPREQPQTRSGGTESGEGGGGAQEGGPQGDGLTDDELHARRAHPDWEYATTTCGRKQGPAPEPDGDGWEPNAYIDMGADPEGKPYPRRNWERFEYHDEEYWRRRRTQETKEKAPKLTFLPENASEPAQDLQSASLGDRLRALIHRPLLGWHEPGCTCHDGGAHGSDQQSPLWALADEADGMTAERDDWKRRRDAAVEQCQFLHQDGLSRHDWHAKHCGAVDAADALRAQVERVRALAEAYRDGASRTTAPVIRQILEEAAGDILAALDDSGSKAGGNGEVGA